MTEQLAVDDITTLRNVLEREMKKFHPFRLKAVDYKMAEGYYEGYIDVEYELSQVVNYVQQVVIDASNPFRSGMTDKDKLKMQNTDGLERKYYEAYGYESIGDLFRPHITFTRLHKNSEEVFEALPKVEDFNGTFDRIGLFEMGENGTCTREVFQISLTNS